MNDITIKIKGDNKDLVAKADAAVARLKKAAQEFNDQAMGKASSQMPFGLDAKSLAEFKRVAEQLRIVNKANYETQQQSLALEVSREKLYQSQLKTQSQQVALEREKIKLLEEQKQLITSTQSKTAIPTKDLAKQAADADIARYNAERLKREKVTNDEIAKSEKALANIKKIESRSATDSVIEDLNREKKKPQSKPLVKQQKRPNSENALSVRSAPSGKRSAELFRAPERS